MNKKPSPKSLRTCWVLNSKHFFTIAINFRSHFAQKVPPRVGKEIVKRSWPKGGPGNIFMRPDKPPTGDSRRQISLAGLARTDLVYACESSPRGQDGI